MILFESFQHFIEPLQLKPEERKKIFLNISVSLLIEQIMYNFLFEKDIHALHSEFYEDLCRAGRNEKGRTSRIVELFTKWQDRFLIYAKYCSELPDAQEFLDRKIKQDTGFAQKLEVNVKLAIDIILFVRSFSNVDRKQANLVNFNCVTLLFCHFNVLLNIHYFYM